jgi:hypothetical protein
MWWSKATQKQKLVASQSNDPERQREGYEPPYNHIQKFMKQAHMDGSRKTRLVTSG